MKILVINCGSSSLKYQLIDMDDESVVAKGLCERIGIEGSKLTHQVPGKDKYIVEQAMPDHKVAIGLVLDALQDAEHGVVKSTDEIAAVGHRVLHAGTKYCESIVVNEDVKKVIRECFDLGPLHNPANLMGIEAAEAAMPGKPNVAVWDTGFGMAMPEKAYLYAIPHEYYEKYSIRRYGFHGTSHRFISGRYTELTGRKDRLIVCHLGNGSSITAVKDGKCLDTSMGLTPLDGFIMGTRCGGIDPSIVTFLMNKEGLTAYKMSDIMNKKSGFLGVSGISSDCRDLIAAAGEGNHRAQLALDMLVYQIKKFIGGYAAAMGGVDAIAFTGGIGENDGNLRKEVCENMEYLGIKFDEEKNKVRGEQKISADDSKVEVWVIPTNEELLIARDTVEIVNKAK